MDKYLVDALVMLGLQGVALLVIRSWFSDVRRRLNHLNGFKERMLENHVTKDDLHRHEDRCKGMHRELFARVHELEVKQ